MHVEFVETCEIETFASFKAKEASTVVFQKGERTKFDEIGIPLRFVDGSFVESETEVDVQFENGSIALCLSRSWFKEV